MSACCTGGTFTAEVNHCPNCGAFPIDRPGPLERDLATLEKRANNFIKKLFECFRCRHCGSYNALFHAHDCLVKFEELLQIPCTAPHPSDAEVQRLQRELAGHEAGIRILERCLEARVVEVRTLHEDLVVAHQIADSFWAAIKPLGLPAINVANPGVHVTTIIEDLAIAQARIGELESEREEAKVMILVARAEKLEHDLLAERESRHAGMKRESRLLDELAYPDEQELKRIRQWPAEDHIALMEYVRLLWKWNDWGWTQRGSLYRISTGGWSGNESLIGALQANWTFWALRWQESRRGGHYIFEVPQEVTP